MSVDAPRQSRLGTRSPIVVQLPDDLADDRSLGRDSRYRPETVHRVVTVAAANGLHMRICAAVATAASRFEAEVRVQIDDRVENAASILGLMLLGVMQGEQLLLSATGPDAGEALQTLAELLGRPALDNAGAAGGLLLILGIVTELAGRSASYVRYPTRNNCF